MTMLKNQSGSALHITIIIILVVAVLGLLGYVLWNNFLRTSPSDAPTASTTEPFCSAEETETADNGTFCSENIGIKFDVPLIFKGSIGEAENYEVFSGTVDYETRMSAGMSEKVFEAKITGNDNYTFTIAKEPLRSGYVDVPHMLSGAYYDQTTGNLSEVPVVSASDEAVVGDDVPSFTVDGTRIFKGTLGDAGTVIITYFAVINDKIIKITLNNSGYMGDPADDPTTIDLTEVLEEFEAGIKALKTLS